MFIRCHIGLIFALILTNLNLPVGLPTRFKLYHYTWLKIIYIVNVK